MTDSERVKMLREELRALAERYHEQHNGAKFEDCNILHCRRAVIVLATTGDEE